MQMLFLFIGWLYNRLELVFEFLLQEVQTC